jgi:transposase
VQQWRKEGLSQRAIADRVGIDRRTVRRYLELTSPPVYPRRSRPRKIGPYLDYLSRRWSQGCQNARQLYRELLQMGYQGSESMLRTVVHPWRLLTRPPPHGRSPPLRRLILPRAARLTEEERSLLGRILEANPLLALGHRLKEDFLQIARDKDVAGLELWLQEAEGSGIATFRAVARGIRQDWQAARAALATPWSTAQCEGQICRLKLIKRLAYGRAKPDLLRQRVLHRSLLAG